MSCKPVITTKRMGKCIEHVASADESEERCDDVHGMNRDQCGRNNVDAEKMEEGIVATA